MRRLISMLAAGLLAAGTVLTAAGAASAGAAAARQGPCVGETAYFWVTAGSVDYYLGAPNKLSSGSAAILKPSENSTTLWTICTVPSSSTFLLENRGLALTSRSASPGADVTLEAPGNGGIGFASQQWELSQTVENGFLNVKTGLGLRVRNGGAVMGQTVTTGHAPTSWISP